LHIFLFLSPKVTGIESNPAREHTRLTLNSDLKKHKIQTMDGKKAVKSRCFFFTRDFNNRPFSKTFLACPRDYMSGDMQGIKRR